MEKKLSKIINYTVLSISMAIEVFFFLIFTLYLIIVDNIVDFKEMLFYMYTAYYC